MKQHAFIVRELTMRELRRKYARSALGILWSVLNPLLSMAVLSLIFSGMFRRSIENYPIYYLCGYLIWQMFTAATMVSISVFADNRALLLKVQLSPELFLIARVMTAFVNLLFSIHILNMSRHAIVADRYMYLSYVGLAFLMGYGLLWVKQKQPAYLKTALGILFVYLIFLSAYTFQYTKKWKNTTMVKEYTKEVLDKRLKQSGDF